MLHHLLQEIPIFVYSAIFILALRLIQRRVLDVPDMIQNEKDSSLRKSLTEEFYGHFGSFANGVVFGGYGLYTFFVADNWSEKNTEMQNHVLTFGLAFFLIDTIFGQLYRFHQIKMVIHHVFCLLFLVNSLGRNQFGYGVLSILGLGEASFPIQVIWLILDKNSRFQREAKLVQVAFCVVFMFLRGPLAWYLSEQFIAHKGTMVIRVCVLIVCWVKRVRFTLLVLPDIQLAGQTLESSELKRCFRVLQSQHAIKG